MPAVGRLLPACLLVAAAACGREPPPGPPGPLVARVMTFNLRWDGFQDGANAWEHRRDLVVRVLRELGADSVGTQEPMVRQIRDVLDAVPTLAVFRFDNDPVYVRTQQILYRRDRFDRIEGDGFLVAEGKNEDGTIRYCTWVRLRDRGTGRCYDHYNVHLDHRSAASRRMSVVRLMKHVADRDVDDPFVITGDFNTGEGSPEMAFLRGERELPDETGAPCENPIPLADTYRVLHPDAPESGSGGGFRGRRDGPMIDHVFVAAGAATVREAEIVHTQAEGRYPSDHFPVTAVVEWP